MMLKRDKHQTVNLQRRKELKFVSVSLAPIMILFSIFIIIPIFWGIVLSLYKYSPISLNSPFIGLENYYNLLKDRVFVKSVVNTFQFVLLAVPGNLILTLSIALGINAVKNRFWKNAFRTIFFLPAIAPLAGSAVVWSTMYNPQGGLFNIVLERLGLQTVNWLSQPTSAMISIVVLTLWVDMGYNIVIFMAGLDSIPDRFYEAAKLDGANPWQRFWYITIPLLKRTTLFVSVMTLISYFQAFPQFQILTNGEPQNETRVLALNIYDHAFTYMNMGYASSMAVVLLLIIFVFTLIQLRLGRTEWNY